MNRFYPLLFCLLMLLSACFKPIEIALPPHESKLVINSVLSPDFEVSAFVGITTASLDQNQMYDSLLKGAQLSLWTEQGTRHAFLPSDTIIQDTLAFYINNGDTIYSIREQYLRGFYLQNPLSITPGHTYRLEAIHPDYEMASASVMIPQAVPLQAVSISPNAAVDIEGSTYAGVSLEFEDPIGANYYHIEARVVDISSRGDTSQYKAYLYNLDAIQNASFQESRVFDDQTFEGTKRGITFYVDSWDLDSSYSDRKLYVRLNATSESFYRYANSYDKFIFNQDLGIGIFPTEPITIYSNIEGGYGTLMAVTYGELVEAK